MYCMMVVGRRGKYEKSLAFGCRLHAAAAQILHSEAAAEAILAVAVGGAELDEGLAVGSRRHTDAGALPAACDVVAFGVHALENVEGPFGHVLIHLLAAIGEEQGRSGVDEQEVERRLLQRFRRASARAAEGVVFLPVGRGLDAEKLAQRIGTVGLEQTREVGAALVVEVSQLREAHVGKVLRPQAAKLPHLRADGLQAKLMPQEGIFRLQAAEMVVAPLLRHQFVGQQPGLTEEERLHLEGIVAVLAHVLRVDGEGPLLEGIGVGAESEVAGKGDEERPLPVASRASQIVGRSDRLLLKAFHREAAQPRAHGDGREVGHDAVAGRIGFLRQQFAVAGLDGGRNLYAHLRRPLPVGRDGLGIDIGDNVENHVVVSRIHVVMVAKPVGGAGVNLHVARPQRAVDAHLGIEEVGAGLQVVHARVDHLHRLPLRCGERDGPAGPQPVLPNVVEQEFHVVVRVG